MSTSTPAVNSEWGCRTWLGDQMVATLMTTQRLHLQARRLWEPWRIKLREAAATPGRTSGGLREVSRQFFLHSIPTARLLNETNHETRKSMDRELREEPTTETDKDMHDFLHRQFKDWSREAEQENASA